MNTNLSDNIEYFKNTTNSYRELGIEFDCHPDSIRYFYKKNGISKKTKVVPITLTEEDYEYIKSNFNTMSILAIAKNLNSTEKVLRRACQDLNLKKDGKHIISNLSDKMYTEDNIQFIKYNIDKGIEFLSKELNRTEASIKKKLWELKIPYASATSWSEQEICFLKKNYLLGEGTISFMLDRSYKSVKHMINTLNLTVTDNKKTSIETIMENYLKKLDIKYIYDMQYSTEYKFRPDFLLPDYNVVIECHGDYWHANPTIYAYEDLNHIQLINVEKDMFKKEYYESKNLKVLIFWENEIQNEDTICERILKECK